MKLSDYGEVATVSMILEMFTISRLLRNQKDKVGSALHLVNI